MRAFRVVLGSASFDGLAIDGSRDERAKEQLMYLIRGGCSEQQIRGGGSASMKVGDGKVKHQGSREDIGKDAGAPTRHPICDALPVVVGDSHCVAGAKQMLGAFILSERADGDCRGRVEARVPPPAAKITYLVVDLASAHDDHWSAAPGRPTELVEGFPCSFRHIAGGIHFI